jgi:predicted transcriptional regulator
MLAVTYIPFKKEQYDRVKKTLAAISEKDTSFKFLIKNRKPPGPEFLALIRSYSFDQAHKRGLLITKKYLADIQPHLNYEVREASPVGQAYLDTRSLKVLSNPQDLALLITLKSDPMPLSELPQVLGLTGLTVRRQLRRLRNSELVAFTNGKFVVTDQGLSILAKMEGSNKSG